jgi:phosphoribosyl-dephospho-CoA transferase
MSESTPFLRHDVVWIDREAPAAVLASPAERAYRVVRWWIGLGRPLVVTRQPSRCDDARRLPVGVSLPLAWDKRRFALEIEPRAISLRRSPALLTSVAARMDYPRRAALCALCAAAKRIDVEYRVFGSAAWEFWTGLRYLTADSDVDLLWRPSSEAQLAQGVSLLDAWEREHGIRADGEILFGEEAVSWREWMYSARSPRVLAKNRRGVLLRSRRELIARLAFNAPSSRQALPRLATCA